MNTSDIYVIGNELYSKTPVVILTLDEYNSLLNKAKENIKLTQIINKLKDIKGMINQADNLCDNIIIGM